MVGQKVIEFILSHNPSTVKEMEVLGKIQSSDHRMVRCKIKLDLKSENGKLVKDRNPSMESVIERMQEFKLTFRNKFNRQGQR